MNSGDKYVAIIPARGGSKRIPRKNCKMLNGKPLIAWTIEAAVNSKYIDDVIVSSDDEEIIDISKKYGAEVPFLRPAELSGDHVATLDVVLHTINSLQKDIKREYDYFVLLQPTAPLREASDIDGAIDFLKKNKADAVISVTEVDHPVEWCNKLPVSLSMDNFLQIDPRVRSQDIPLSYRLNGAIFICRVNRFLEKGTYFLDKNVYAYIMPKERSVDIDTNLDFRLAELLLS